MGGLDHNKNLLGLNNNTPAGNMKYSLIDNIFVAVQIHDKAYPRTLLNDLK